MNFFHDKRNQGPAKLRFAAPISQTVLAEAVAGAAVGQQVAVAAAVVVDEALRGAGADPGGSAAGVDEGRHLDRRAVPFILRLRD